MLMLHGTLRAATQLGGGVNRKTGEVIPVRNVLQVETIDNRGLVEMITITVPSLAGFVERVGERVELPVRAWAPAAKVGYVFEDKSH